MESRDGSKALERGILGHGVLEGFYHMLMEGESYDEAVKFIERQMLLHMSQNMSNPEVDFEDTRKLFQRILLYLEEHRSDVDLFRVIGVESTVEFPLPNSQAAFKGRIDLEVEYIAGPHRGELAPWDHKFVHNFWSSVPLRINAQLPNYIHGMRKKYPGATVNHAVVNQIRYADNAVDKFRRSEITPPSNTRINAILANHARVADQIVEVSLMDRETAIKNTTKSISQYNCKFCPFTFLCSAELDGAETIEIERVGFVPNSYGYGEEQDE